MVWRNAIYTMVMYHSNAPHTRVILLYSVRSRCTRSNARTCRAGGTHARVEGVGAAVRHVEEVAPREPLLGARRPQRPRHLPPPPRAACQDNSPSSLHVSMPLPCQHRTARQITQYLIENISQTKSGAPCTSTRVRGYTWRGALSPLPLCREAAP